MKKFHVFRLSKAESGQLYGGQTEISGEPGTPNRPVSEPTAEICALSCCDLCTSSTGRKYCCRCKAHC